MSDRRTQDEIEADMERAERLVEHQCERGMDGLAHRGESGLPECSVCRRRHGGEVTHACE